ncbi:hypothetical protein SAMN04487943_10555 [Gracilibacillus orientalis]|uniref:Uncharacterized protein n=1 Tax=Gracilibacillus orientalis TaxID=334253 RepID=A0A1I4LJL9_9BACI|nr:hypothetical protein [Gracilibacillus orientalis]SFL91046.1 hypothetical protein SAMN04487943_10555 [Gracilibacillus orientalis]
MSIARLSQLTILALILHLLTKKTIHSEEDKDNRKTYDKVS